MGTLSNQFNESVRRLADAVVIALEQRIGASNVDGESMFKKVLKMDLSPYSLRTLEQMVRKSREPHTLLLDALQWVEWIRRNRDFDLADSLSPFRDNLRALLYSASECERMLNALERNRRHFGRGTRSLDELQDLAIDGTIVFVEWCDNSRNSNHTLSFGPLNPATRGDICVACSAAHILNESSDQGEIAQTILGTLNTRERTRQPGKERLLVEVVPVCKGTLLLTGEHVMAIAGDATAYGGHLIGRSLQESQQRVASYLRSALGRQLTVHADQDGAYCLRGAPDGEYVALLPLSDPLSFGVVGGLHAVAAIVRRGRVYTYDALKGLAGIALNSPQVLFRVA